MAYGRRKAYRRTYRRPRRYGRKKAHYKRKRTGRGKVYRNKMGYKKYKGVKMFKGLSYSEYPVAIPFKVYSKLSYWAKLLIQNESLMKHKGQKFTGREYKILHNHFVEEMLITKTYEFWMQRKNCEVVNFMHTHHVNASNNNHRATNAELRRPRMGFGGMTQNGLVEKVENKLKKGMVGKIGGFFKVAESVGLQGAMF